MIEKHGEISKDPNWSDARWCEVCNDYHGILFECESYPEEIKKEIVSQTELFRNKLEKNPLKEPIPNAIMRMFLGMDIGENR